MPDSKIIKSLNLNNLTSWLYKKRQFSLMYAKPIASLTLMNRPIQTLPLEEPVQVVTPSCLH